MTWLYDDKLLASHATQHGGREGEAKRTVKGEGSCVPGAALESLTPLTADFMECLWNLNLQT